MNEKSNKKSKKKFLILAVFIILILIRICIPPAIFYGMPIGYIEKEEYYDETGFTEFMDYAKYVYPFKSIISYNKKYEILKENNIDKVRDYFSDFSFSLSNELEGVYDFDEDIITEGDYVRVQNAEQFNYPSGSFGNYTNLTIFYFDVETLTLYYIHKNY